MRQVYISPYVLLFLAVICFAVGYKILLILFIPVLVHELGHIAAMRIFGMDIRSFRAELKGLCISFTGRDASPEEAVIAAAGPLAGLLYAAAAFFLAERADAEWVRISCGSSILLSLFNLLPAYPLDGEKIASAVLRRFCGNKRGEAASEALSKIISLCVFILGLCLTANGMGVSVCISGAWLLISQLSD